MLAPAQGYPKLSTVRDRARSGVSASSADARQRMHGKSMQAIGSSRRSRVPPLGAAEAQHVNGADGPQSSQPSRLPS